MPYGSEELLTDDERLEAVIADYLEEVDRSGRPDIESYLTRHPDLADGFRQFLANWEHFRGVATVVPSRPFSEASPRSGDMPRRFGNYELLEQIGQGGMGVVYKARQLPLDRIVAVKMLHLAGNPLAVTIRDLRSEISDCPRPSAASAFIIKPKFEEETSATFVLLATRPILAQTTRSSVASGSIRRDPHAFFVAESSRSGDRAPVGVFRDGSRRRKLRLPRGCAGLRRQRLQAVAIYAE